MIPLTPKRLIFAIFLLFLLYSIGYWSSKSFQSGKMRNYISLIIQLSGIISLAMLLFDISSKESARVTTEAKNFALQTENYFIDVEQNFQRSFPQGARLYRSMNPQFKELQDLPLPEVNEIQERMWEIQMGIIIFQKIENVLLENVHADFSKGKQKEWLTTWIHWISSPRLREIWNESKDIFYSQETRDFVDKVLIPASDKLQAEGSHEETSNALHSGFKPT